MNYQMVFSGGKGTVRGLGPRRAAVTGTSPPCGLLPGLARAKLQKTEVVFWVFAF